MSPFFSAFSLYPHRKGHWCAHCWKQRLGTALCWQDTRNISTHMRQSFVRCTLALSSRAETMLHCWTSRLVWSRRSPPTGASWKSRTLSKCIFSFTSVEYQVRENSCCIMFFRNDSTNALIFFSSYRTQEQWNSNMSLCSILWLWGWFESASGCMLFINISFYSPFQVGCLCVRHQLTQCSKVNKSYEQH